MPGPTSGNRLDQRLEILRKVVLAGGEDDVLRAPGDHELAFVHEPHVARIEPAVRDELHPVTAGALVVADGDVVTADLDVSHDAIRHDRCLIVRDAKPDVLEGAADLHQPRRLDIARIDDSGRRTDRERFTIHRHHVNAAFGTSKTDGNRRLRKPVDREHGRRPQPAGGQGSCELFAKVGRDGLGTVQDEPHPREFHAVGLGVIERTQEMAVAEVGGAQDGRALFRRLLHPQQGPAHEDLGRHEVLIVSERKRSQVESDQAHVVGERHPRQGDVARCRDRALVDRVEIRGDVPVRELDALRAAGRSGGELDHRDVVRSCRLADSALPRIFDLIEKDRPCRKLFRLAAQADALGEGTIALEDLFPRAQERVLQAFAHVQQTHALLFGVADCDRHGDDAPELARPERVDELLVARKEQDHLGTRSRPLRLEVMEQRERAVVDLGVGNGQLVVLAFDVGHT